MNQLATGHPDAPGPGAGDDDRAAWLARGRNINARQPGRAVRSPSCPMPRTEPLPHLTAADLRGTFAGRLVRVEPLARRARARADRGGRRPRDVRVDARGHGLLARRAARLADQHAGAPRARAARCRIAIVAADDGRVLGSTRFLEMRFEHLRAEIGWTWLARSAWSTGANVETKLLLLEHAFERVGLRRVEFKTDARNERSRGALLALGATFEGILRKHMVVRDGGAARLRLLLGDRRRVARGQAPPRRAPRRGASLTGRMAGSRTARRLACALVLAVLLPAAAAQRRDCARRPRAGAARRGHLRRHGARRPRGCT